MTETSRPWNGTVTGDAGPYSDSDWQELYRAIIGYGAERANNGVFLMSGTQPADGLKVRAANPATTVIEVLKGSALIQGIAYISTATESFTIAANASGNPRIDTIVLQADYALQTVRLAKLQGTPAASPSAPSLTQTPDVLWEIPLADIAVANGFVTITDANISPRQEWVNAPPAVYLDYVLNNSGTVLNDGQVVVWDTTADRAVTTTTTRDLKRVAGVVRGQIAASGYGRIQRLGIGYVKADAAVTRGDLLTTGTTAGSATTPGTNQAALNGVYGRALETTSGAGLVLAFIDARIVNDFDLVLIQDQRAANTAAQVLGVATQTTRNLNTEVLDTGGIATLSLNRVNLPRGRYTVVGHASSGANLGGHRIRLRDVTNNATLLQGTNSNNTSVAMISGEFDLTATVDIELQHYSTLGGAGGTVTNNGELEIYASLLFTRHGETG